VNCGIAVIVELTASCILADAGTVFTWNSTAAITGVDFVVLEDEVAVLHCFASFVNKVDPDVFTGFNV
jgi:hypothetical protein